MIAFALLAVCLPGPVLDDAPRFERIVVDSAFPGGYQVEVADVNGDGKLDIIALGGDTCAWYENPSWTKRIITTGKQSPGIISSATADIDGDGKAEVAIAYEFAMNRPKQGKLLMAVQGAAIDDPWSVREIADVPSIHRLRWGKIDRDNARTLVIAPLFGPDAAPPQYADPTNLRLFHPGEGTNKLDIVTPSDEAQSGFRVMHAIEVTPLGDAGPDSILTASNHGVDLLRFAPKLDGKPGWMHRPLVSGAEADAPKRGSSEVHLGKIANGKHLLATIEPWHGNQVVVYPSQGPDMLKFPDRVVIDDTLDDGHALWLADIDGDGNDEVFAGHRGKDHRVSVYKIDGKTWNKTVIDREIAAQDLRGGDLNGDGKPEIVAIGGSTHNVVIYRPQ